MEDSRDIDINTKYQVSVDFYKDAIRLSWDLFRIYVFIQAVLLALFGALADKELFGFTLVISTIGIGLSLVCLWVPRRFQKYVDAALQTSKTLEKGNGPMTEIKKLWHANEVKEYHIYSVVNAFVSLLIFIWLCIFLYSLRTTFCEIVSCVS